MPKIMVHEKALAHLSRGLYRSPASALRELVSNAWDANARIVRIGTNYPLFYQLSIVDNGDGFTKGEFEGIMGGGIGNSIKRTDDAKLINNRPVIGRLGIGMLGIAQICGGFTVTSKPKEGKGFRANVKLYDLLREKLDQDDETIIRDEEVDVGEYEWDKYEASNVDYGTTITSNDVHPTFIRSFQQSLKFEQFKEPPIEWEKALKIVSNVRSLQELGDYWRLLWELAASCPVPYLSKNALPDKLIAEEQAKLKSYDFKVIVDGIDLKKPIFLKNNPGGYTSFKIENQNLMIYGKPLSFHGYLLVQEGAQLRPDELRGIMVRVRNVGIGYYDPSMLDYRYNEGPRSRWLTGEIFVDTGLENALNIDRDSFNRFHPEFRAIQEFVHQKLHQNIFPISYKKIEDRSTVRKDTLSKNRAEHLKNVIAEQIEVPVKISQETGKLTVVEKKTQTRLDAPLVNVAINRDEAEVSLPNQELIKTKKTHKQLASSILAIFEIAVKEDDPKKQRDIFTELLLKLLEGW